MKNYQHNHRKLPNAHRSTTPNPQALGTISQNKSMAFLRLAVICCAMLGMMAGCINDRTVTIGPPTKQPSGGKMPYFGKEATILATEYNAIAIRYGDTVTLDFPCDATLPNPIPQGVGMQAKGDKVRLWLVQEGKVAAKGSGPSPNGPSTPTPTTVTVKFPIPAFTFKLYNNPNEEVWPGDANADGYRNMLDLYAIAEAIKVTVAPAGCTPAPPMLSFPPNETGDMNILYKACPWGATFQWENEPIDFMHADCNLDGKISELDADYLRAVMDPMYRPEFLKSAMDGASLKATYAGTNGGIELPLINGKFAVRLPFDISFASDPLAPFVIDSSFFGVIFSRPVAESSQYHLLDTRLDFANSGIFTPDPKNTVWRQKFWPDFELEYADGNCADASDRVLDVGAFRLSVPSGTPSDPLRIGHCQVTLDDILCPPGSSMPLTLFTLIQHTVNGVMFTRNQDGVIVPQTIACATDSTVIDSLSLCQGHDILISDGVGDDATIAITPESNAWSSPDIWVRHAGGPANSTAHQQPINGDSEEVYVRVFNRSCYPSEEGTVDVFWAYANTHESWGDFKQHHIGQVSVPVIPAFRDTVVMLTWNPSFEAGSPEGNCSAVISLLALVHTSNDPIVLPQNKGDIHDWVLSNNNVAMRSTMALQTGRNGTCAMISLRPEPSSTSLFIEQVAGPKNLPASHFGDLDVHINGYVSIAANPSGMISLGNQTYRLEPEFESGSLSMRSITGNPTLQVSFVPKQPGTVLPNLSSAQHYAFRIYVKVGGAVQNSSIVEFTVQ